MKKSRPREGSSILDPRPRPPPSVCDPGLPECLHSPQLLKVLPFWGCPVGVLVPHEPPNRSYFHVQNTSLQIHAHLSFQSLIPSFYICYHQKEPSTLSEIQKEPCYYGEAGHWREEGPRMPIILTWKVNETNIYWVPSTSRCHLTKALS